MNKNMLSTSSNQSIKARGGRAQGLVEFALVLPIVVFSVFMLFDLGRAVYYYSVLTNAAREGARYGVVNCVSNATGVPSLAIPQQAVIDKVVERSFGVIPDPSNIQVLIEKTTRTFGSGQGAVTRDEYSLRIKVTYAYAPLTPFLNRFLGSNVIQVVTDSRMQIE